MSDESDSIVCFCHCVTQQSLLQAIREGAKTLVDIQEKTQASTGCGGCEPDVLEILEKALASA